MADTDDDKKIDTADDRPETGAAQEADAQQARIAESADDEVIEAQVEEAEIVEDIPDPQPEPVAETGPAPTPAPQPKRKGGLFIPLIGGVLAAGIGYGAAQYIKPEGWPFPGTATGADDAALSALSDRLAALEGRVANLPTEPAPGQAPDMSAYDDRLGALAKQVAALETGLENARITGGGDEAAAALAAYQQELEQMRAELATQRDENARLAQSVAAVADEAEAEVDAAMERAALIEARAAIMRIDAALASGAPFAGALPQLGEIEVPAALADIAGQGVATLAALQEDFPTAARAALDAALKQRADGDVGDRVGAFLRSQLGVRSLTPREGDDADAVLSRAEAALRQGALDAALAELDMLPDAARGEMAGWIARAVARQQAVAAAQSIAQSLNSN
ncbi:hypothetical protein EV663_106111 [Rhodovulum bhavnagarense]|uniref:Inner membrane protein n=1 Tax=Rhodovulum bhavnagarense TaxID=992286 RepID=A0A4R2REY9_9RHOB|nr:hypothetical protein [Rhodovulum bhavnagarense]TCP61164.1 hypothetical protein EV663_106111 [Rhodovulum bhavnagarense]